MDFRETPGLTTIEFKTKLSRNVTVFCFLFTAVSTYNFEVTCLVKVGVLFLINT
jgi:hypothetical protein